MSRRRALLLTTLIAVPLLAYGAGSAVVWDKLTAVPTQCGGRWTENTPQAFEAPEEYELDTTPWLMPAPEEVRIPSRDPGIEIAGWWMPAETRSRGAGRRRSSSSTGSPRAATTTRCCCRPGCCTRPASRSCSSTCATTATPPARTGASPAARTNTATCWARGTGSGPSRASRRPRSASLGVSLGAATVLLATGQEPEVAAVWEDSSYADLPSAIDAELSRNGYPTFLAFGGVLAARLISGDDLTSYSPLDAVGMLDGRPLFITHGTADTRLSVDYGHRLEAAVRADGGDVESWYVDGAEHVESMLTDTEEYEQRLVAFFAGALATPAVPAPSG